LAADYVARDICLSGVCPEGFLNGRCREPSHWAAVRASPSADAEPRDPNRKAMTMAHLLQTAGYNMGHAITHTDAAKKLAGADGGEETDLQFNLDHASHHLAETQDHLKRLMDHIKEHYPQEAAELKKLEKTEVT